jgi:hypothetical protein
VNHRASPRFWNCYRLLPADVQRLADSCYELLRRDPRHPSLHLKGIGRYWSARVGLHHWALAVSDGPDLVWF